MQKRKRVSNNAIHRQVLPSTDKFVRKNFQSIILRKSVKTSKKAMLKQIGSNTDKIISKPFPNYLF